MACERIETGASERFKQFTSRELMTELQCRGFHGKLKYYKVEEFDL